MALGGFAPFPLPLGGTAVDGLTAEQHARLSADLSACVRTVPFAMLHWSMATGTIINYRGQHGLGVSAAPTLIDNGLGDWTVQWEPSYLDEYGIACPTNIKWGRANHTALASRFAQVQLVDRRTVRVYGYDTVGGASDISPFLVVY